MKFKKLFSLVLSIVLLVSCFANVNVFAETDYAQQLRNAGFPESYVSRLLVLHEQHPNWQFEAVNCSSKNPGYTFDYIVNAECTEARNLVTTSSWAPSPWNTLGVNNYTPYYDQNNTKLYDSGAWRQASKDAIRYFLDPRNFLNEIDVFMFETLEFNENTQTLDRVKSALAGSFMAGNTLCDNGITYAQHIYNCGETYNISPVFLAGRLKSEQGEGGSPLVKGTLGTALYNYYINKNTYEGDADIWGSISKTTVFNTNELLNYDGYYNFFNIDAGGTGKFAIYYNAANEAVNGGWNTKAKAISGGAQRIANTYVGDYQDTVYFQKFNTDSRSSRFTWGQYQQAISVTITEARNTYAAYNNGGIIDNAYRFKIPVYTGMPASACPDPANGNSYLSPTIKTDGVDSTVTVTETRYRVQCGSYSVKSNAENYILTLKGKGINATLETVGDQYIVVEGYYNTSAEAQARINQLSALDVSAISTEVNTSVTKYLAAISCSANGTAVLSNGGGYAFFASGDTVSFSVTPNDGYVVSSIKVGENAVEIKNGGNAATYTFTMPAAPQKIEVTFAELTYTATISANEGGTAVFGDNSTVRKIKPGANASYKLTPDEGYVVSSIKINGKAVGVQDNGAAKTYWFPMPGNDVEIEVTFAELTYTATISANEGGTAVFGDNSTVRNIIPGANASYKLTPDDGYVISSIKINGKAVSVQDNGAAKTYWFPMPGNDVEIEVVFAKLYSANISVIGGGTAVFKAFNSQNASIIAGKSVSISVTPENGYVLQSYKINGSLKAISNNGKEYTYWFTMPEKDTNIEMVFVPEVSAGDINKDNIVDNLDLIRMKKAAVGIVKITDITGADANGDGVFNVLDIIRLKNYLAGKDVKLGK